MLLLQVHEQEEGRPKRPLYLTERLFFALRSVTLSHNVHEREIQMIKMTKGNNNGKDLCKGDMEHINN